MLTLLGNPRADYGSDCRSMANPRLKPLMLTRNVGPFSVTGLAPAVESLGAVMAEIKAAQPEVFGVLGTVGIFCARFVRGSNTSISNHSWGTAIDLWRGRYADSDQT